MQFIWCNMRALCVVLWQDLLRLQTLKQVRIIKNDVTFYFYFIISDIWRKHKRLIIFNFSFFHFIIFLESSFHPTLFQNIILSSLNEISNFLTYFFLPNDMKSFLSSYVSNYLRFHDVVQGPNRRDVIDSRQSHRCFHTSRSSRSGRNNSR